MTYLISKQWTLNKSRDDDSGFTAHGTEEGVGEFSGCPSHTQSRAAGTIFGFNDFVSTELDSLDQFLPFFAYNKFLSIK